MASTENLLSFSTNRIISPHENIFICSLETYWRFSTSPCVSITHHLHHDCDKIDGTGYNRAKSCAFFSSPLPIMHDVTHLFDDIVMLTGIPYLHVSRVENGTNIERTAWNTVISLHRSLALRWLKNIIQSAFSSYISFFHVHLLNLVPIFFSLQLYYSLVSYGITNNIFAIYA